MKNNLLGLLIPFVLIASAQSAYAYSDIYNIEGKENLIIISPHQDDALLTFGGYLQFLKDAGKLDNVRTEINVMVGLSNYSTNWHNVTTEHRVMHISKNRYSEDLDGLSNLFGGWDKFRYKIQGLWDAPLRGYEGRETAGGGSAGTFKDFRQEEISEFNYAVEIIKPMLINDKSLVLVPIANGNHIDHFIMKEAVIKAAYILGDEAKATIIFGQDQPYTGANPSGENEEIDALIKRLPSNAITKNYVTLIKDTNGETSKLRIYKKDYLTQYDEGYLIPLENNIEETLYVWKPSTYKSVKSHIDCGVNQTFCKLAE